MFGLGQFRCARTAGAILGFAIMLHSGGLRAQLNSTTSSAAGTMAVPGMPAPSAPLSPDGGLTAGAPVPVAPRSGQGGGEGMVKVSFADAKVEKVLGLIAQQSGKNVSPRGKVAGQQVTLILRDPVPLERALDMIVNQKPNWLVYKPDDQPGTYEIWDQESFKTDVLPKQVRQKVFVPREITAEDAYKAIQGILTPNIGSAAFDPRSNKVFVTDLPPTLELAQRLIEQIDVKFMTRVFRITHADINAMAEKLSNMHSPSAPPVEVDERTHQILVRDRFDVIRQMELLVETLDIGPEMRVYDLNNLGFEGKNKSDLEDAINRILTPNAFFQINVQSAKMIVEDVDEVHEKIEKILQAFDQPAKQVLIQAEVIETEFKEGMDYSIDYAFSSDLFSSVVDKLVGTPTVPTGSGTVDPSTLGFVDFRKEFPVVTGGASGLTGQNLSRHAFISLKSSMSDSRTRILQQPRLLVKNQEAATFSVGQKIPFFTGGTIGYSTTTNGSGQVVNAPSQPVQNLLQVGLDLEIHPTISNNGLIELEVNIRNNTPLTINRVFAGQVYTGVGSNDQEIETVLTIPSGETRVIGGLVTDSVSVSHSGIPGLTKIPVLGPLLFGSYSKPVDDNRRGNLLLFLTPTIVVEKPQDLYKYKGRVMVNDKVPDDLFSTPTATLSDVQCDPVPIDLPVPQEPVRVMSSPKVKISPPAEETPVPVLPPVEEETPDTKPDGMATLRKIHITDRTLTGSQGMVPRGLSGALTGGGSSATAGTSTGGVPGTAGSPGSTAAGVVRPGVPVGAVSQPAAVAATPAPTPFPTPVPTPVPTPIPTAPPTETKF